MFDSKHPASRRARPETDDSQSLENVSPRETHDAENDDSDGSLRSHLWYGFCTLAFIVPFFIPGIPRREMLITYLAIGAVLMIAPMAWGVLRSAREAWQARRGRPRRGWLV